MADAKEKPGKEVSDLLDVISTLVGALDDASGVVDVGRDDDGTPTEEYAYQSELEQGRGVLEKYGRA